MVADRAGLGEALEKKQSKAMAAARGKSVAGGIPIPIPTTDSEPRERRLSSTRLAESDARTPATTLLSKRCQLSELLFFGLSKPPSSSLFPCFSFLLLFFPDIYIK
jgi:hypothetical protein